MTVGTVLVLLVLCLAATTVTFGAGRGQPGPVRRAVIPVSGDDTALPKLLHDPDVEEDDPSDRRFEDSTAGNALYWLVTGVGPRGEGRKGHFGE